MNFDPSEIFSINNNSAFAEMALKVFRHQAAHCKVYHDYLYHLKVDPNKIAEIEKIPFLPISFFKSHQVVSSVQKPVITFTSSGTTGQITSKHFVTDLDYYEQSFNKTFQQFYGNPKQICILALLPSYLEREGSSLIYMVDDLLKQSEHPLSGYFLHNSKQLFTTLQELNNTNQPTILFGVTYALLDFVEQFKVDFPSLIVMETGGMKGKRKEMVREELHQILGAGFGVDKIHSEYGMTELLSQGYSNGDGIFDCPPWMKIMLRDPSDPLSPLLNRQSGGINVIDLANVNSCAFIATQDLGKTHQNGTFEVLGRFDSADIRGCNLLVQ